LSAYYIERHFASIYKKGLITQEDLKY